MPGVYLCLSIEDRLRIEEQTAHHKAEAVRLSVLLDRSACAMRLPDELLGEIFRYYRARQLEARRAGSHRPSSWYTAIHDWVKVTHVRHHWRTVALQEHSLWALIKAENTDCLCVLIARSGEAPLTVNRWDPHGPDICAEEVGLAWKHILSVSSRVHSLTISFSASMLSSHLLPERDHELFPELRVLHLKGPNIWYLRFPYQTIPY